MKSISITDKLILYFVSLGVVVIMIIGSYSYFFAKKALLDRTFDQLISLRLEKKNRIEQFFSDRDRDISIIGQSEEIVEILDSSESINSSAFGTNQLHYSSYLNKYISSYGYFHRIIVINRELNFFIINTHQVQLGENEGAETTISESLKNFCKEIETSDRPLIQDFTRSDLMIYMGSTIVDHSNKLVGFVVLEIPISAINNIMFGYSETNGLGESGETYLVGDDFLMRSNSRFRENAVLNINVTTEAVKNAFQDKPGYGIVDDYRGISCLSSYSKVDIADLNWVILAEIDVQEAMIPIYSIRNHILFISIIIAASVFVVALVVSRRITMPLKRLQRASEEIGNGNYDIHLKVTSQDETGTLTEAFNEMAGRLKKQNLQIEEEKTKRVSSLIDGQEIERQRLSRDLHDSLGQSLLATKIKLEQARNANPERNRQIIDETRELLKQTITEIRSISNDLMPPVLDAFGIVQGLKNLCNSTAATTGIEIDFSGGEIPCNLNSRVQIYLYRISQEAMNNVIKHSKATKVQFGLSCDEGMISLMISDNGKGFEVDKTRETGNGIMNIKERVSLLKGTCHLSSNPETGTRIQIKIPITQNDEN